MSFTVLPSLGLSAPPVSDKWQLTGVGIAHPLPPLFWSGNGCWKETLTWWNGARGKMKKKGPIIVLAFLSVCPFDSAVEWVLRSRKNIKWWKYELSASLFSHTSLLFSFCWRFPQPTDWLKMSVFLIPAETNTDERVAEWCVMNCVAVHKERIEDSTTFASAWSRRRRRHPSGFGQEY